MNTTNLYVICHAFVEITLIICITVASFYFNKQGLLWLYLIPVIGMSYSIAMPESNDSNNKKDE